MESALPLDKDQSPAGDSMLGHELGGYRVIRKIAQGGMGAVYEGVSRTLGRRAAVKVLLPELLNSADAASRFFNEATAVSLVSHPNLVNIYAHGTSPIGEAYIVMEFLDGDSLRERLEKRYMGASALGLMRQLATGLTATHEKRIIHRDLKPENIMLVTDSAAAGGERAKILDFGIAKLLPSATEPEKRSIKTRTGTLIGTPTYMSPEQCRASAAEPPDEKTDVYALGIVFFELLYGEPPFTSESAGELFALQMFAPPPELRERVPTVNPAVSELINRLLAKKAASRPTMAELLGELNALPSTGLSDGPVQSRPSAQQGAGTGAEAANSSAIRKHLSVKTGNTMHTTRGEQVAAPARRGVWAAAVAGCVVAVGSAALLLLSARPPVRPPAPVVAVPAPAPTPVSPVDAGTSPAPTLPVLGSGVAQTPEADDVDTKAHKRSLRKGSRKSGSQKANNDQFQIDVWK